MDTVRLSRTRTWSNFAIFLVGFLGILVGLLPDLVSGHVPIGSLMGVLYAAVLVLGGGACLAIAVSQMRLLLDRRPGLAIVGDRLDIHPFWMTEASVALGRIARVTFEQYEFFMRNTTHSQRHRLRVELKP